MAKLYHSCPDALNAQVSEKNISSSNLLKELLGVRGGLWCGMVRNGASTQENQVLLPNIRVPGGREVSVFLNQ